MERSVLRSMSAIPGESPAGGQVGNSSHREPSSHRAPEANRDSQIHVILVEDRPIDAELVVLELEREGFAPEWVRVQSAAALINALDTPAELVLSDWRMPGFTGLEALEIVRSRAGDLPFILVSGSIGEEAAIDALHRGADDYIFKDRMGRLGPAVRRALLGREERATHHRLDLEWRRLSEAIEQAHDAVVITDTEPRILYVNPAFERITGYTREEAVGQNPRIVQSGSHPPSFYQAMWASLTSGRVVGRRVHQPAQGRLPVLHAVEHLADPRPGRLDRELRVGRP